MPAVINRVEQGVELRGKNYYIRWRVPARYVEVAGMKEINRSLRTTCRQEAKAKCEVAKAVMMKDWDLQLSKTNGGSSVERYEQSLNLLEDFGLQPISQEALLQGSIEALVDRVGRLEKLDKNSAVVEAALAGPAYPEVRVSEMAAQIKKWHARRLANKTKKQLDSWHRRYIRAADAFVEVVGDKPVMDITEDDAQLFLDHLQDQIDGQQYTVGYAARFAGKMAEMMEAYFLKYKVSLKRRNNFFRAQKLKETVKPKAQPKIPFPTWWVEERLIKQIGCEALPQDERDLNTLIGVTGARQSEITDLPPEAFKLDDPIPHIVISEQEDGDFKREIKNTASKRCIPLLGDALEAAKRNPNGFPKFRGLGNYSDHMNGQFRDLNLFPAKEEGQIGEYSMSGTRHEFEDRMISAGLLGEERGYLMGHSMAAIRNRPVYGSSLELQMRALLMEMLTPATDTFKPRNIVELRREIDRIQAERGFQMAKTRE